MSQILATFQNLYSLVYVKEDKEFKIVGPNPWGEARRYRWSEPDTLYVFSGQPTQNFAEYKQHILWNLLEQIFPKAKTFRNKFKPSVSRSNYYYTSQQAHDLYQFLVLVTEKIINTETLEVAEKKKSKLEKELEKCKSKLNDLESTIAQQKESLTKKIEELEQKIRPLNKVTNLWTLDRKEISEIAASLN